MKYFAFLLSFLILSCNSSEKKRTLLLSQKDSIDIQLNDTIQKYVQKIEMAKRDSSVDVRKYDSLSAVYFEDLKLVMNLKDTMRQIQQIKSRSIFKLDSLKEMSQAVLIKKRQAIVEALNALEN